MTSTKAPKNAAVQMARALVGKNIGGPVRNDAVFFSLRAIEPWIGWSVAAYTGVVTLLAHPQELTLWLFVVHALLVGKWAQVHPPHHQLQLFLRALALLAGGFVLLNHVHLELGSGSDFFFWLAVPALAYSLMLRPGWGWALSALAAFAWVLASLHTRSHAPWLPMLAQGAFLLVFPPLVCARFAQAMQALEEALEESQRDRPTGLFNKAGLLRHGHELVETCRREKKALTAVLVDCAGLRELHDAHGRRAGRKALAALVQQLKDVVGEQGLAARSDSMEFTLLLPGVDQDRALRAVHKVMGPQPRVAVQAGQAEVGFEPSLLVRALPTSGAPLEDLLDELGRELQGESQAGGPGTSLQAGNTEDGAGSTPPGDGVDIPTIDLLAEPLPA
jgi:diguanylate cyclase (GGDEF)-like protein